MVKRKDDSVLKNLQAATEAENVRRRAMRKVRRSCLHRNSNGSIILEESKFDKGLWTCSRCGVSVTLAPIDNTQLLVATELVVNAIEQTRITSTADDKDSIAIAEELANTRMTVENLPEIYRGMQEAFGDKKGRKKKNKNKKNKNRSHGRYV